MTFFPILLAIMSLASPKEAEVVTTTTVTKAVPPTVNKTLMLDLVNAVRKKGCQCGDKYFPSTGPVVWNDLLEQAAFKHSNDMSKNDFFSHVSTDGTSGGERLDAIGYKWIAFGENIGMGYEDEKQVVAAWVQSPTHCQNLMGNYKEMGVARAGLYWTQDFGSRQ
jgi:uncharacterized protein YkwD